MEKDDDPEAPPRWLIWLLLTLAVIATAWSIAASGAALFR
jgi:hypothetical protein